MAKKTTKPKGPSDEDKKRSHERFLLVWSSIVSLLKTITVAAAVVASIYVIFYLPLTVAPGGTTIVENTQRLAAHISAHVYVAWGVAATSTLLWRRERNQKLKERKEKDERIRKLERKLDPNVTSSGLNVEGTSAVSE